MLISEVASPELEGLREIVLPEPVSYAPQTVGWYVLLAALLALVGWLAHRRYRHWKRNRYRSWALARLAVIQDRLQEPGEHAAALTAIPELVKQTALELSPRQAVAELSGEPWLAFLDRTYPGKEFSQGAGRLLADLSYAPPEALPAEGDQRLTELLSLVGRWIRGHRPPPEATAAAVSIHTGEA